MNGERHRIVGQNRRRVDARAKVTGQTRFADDIALPRTLYCKLLRSPYSHAHILEIDAARARALAGVHLVLTGADLPIPFGILPVSQDEQALCSGKVRYVGDPVAAVVAVDEWTALEALDLIDVEYEPLRTISEPEESLKLLEPRIHDSGESGNIHRRISFAFGEPETGFADADHVFEDIFFYAGSTHLALEEHAAIAAVDPDGKLTIWSSTQVPHYLHRVLARVLDRAPAHIRVIATPNGGGFGGKSDVMNHEIVVAKAALVLGRPVKITLTREEVFYAHRGRHPTWMRLKTGVKNDGTITALHLQTLLDGGAYGSYGVATAYYSGALQTTTYHIPCYQFDACRVFTNKPACGPKRGHGTPQPRFGQEVQLDKIAEALDIDPAEFRLRIAESTGAVTANHLQLGTVGLSECLRRVVDLSGWKENHGKSPEGTGFGLACSAYLSGASVPVYWNAMPHSGVQLKLDRSGGVTVFCGATEIGQGSDDVLAAIVADELGMDPFDIRLVTGDTSLTPVDLGSYSSRVTLMAGNAALEAAKKARRLLSQAVAKYLGVSEDQIMFADGYVFCAHDSRKGVSFREAVCLAEARFGTIGTVGSYTPAPPKARYKGGGVGPSPTYSYTAAVVKAHVDRNTGWVSIPKVWIVHDIGQAINPMSARGQVIGCVYMGLGEALMEEQAFRPVRANGTDPLVLKSMSMLDYKTLTCVDMPEVVTEFVGDADPAGPFGAKEVGQGPLLPIAPAVANAVYDAVHVRIDEVPMTPEKVLQALEAKVSGQPPRFGPSHFPEIIWPNPLDVLPPWEEDEGRATTESSKKPSVHGAEGPCS